MIIEVVILAVLLGLCLGGRVQRLLELKLRGLPLLVVPVLVSLLPRFPPLGAALEGLGVPATVAMAFLRYGLLAAFAALNWRLPPVCAVGLGGILNFLVTVANGGCMPVSRSVLGIDGGADMRLLRQGEILNYRIMDASTRLWPLGDIIRVRGFFIYFLSAGDILIALGVFGLILQLMGPCRPARLFAAKRRQ